MVQHAFHSPLGALTVTEEDDAIVSLDWGWPRDHAATPLLREAERQLTAYFNHKLKRFDLPLAPRGTPFQGRVWAALRDIPFGARRTYGQIAETIASAPRAVGGACARNPIPILIPCHRVIGVGGRLGGYSGADGLETKTRLLRLEEAG